MARLNFEALFTIDESGRVEPRQRIRIGGVTFGPGAKLGQGVLIAGVDLSQFAGHDFDVEFDEKNNVLVIRGIY